jgi:hypothetical protein
MTLRGLIRQPPSRWRSPDLAVAALLREGARRPAVMQSGDDQASGGARRPSQHPRKLRSLGTRRELDGLKVEPIPVADGALVHLFVVADEPAHTLAVRFNGRIRAA